jgi:ribosomal protein L29
MAKKKSTIVAVSPHQIKEQQHDLYKARVKHSLRSLDNVKTLRAAKKLIAQYKTALTAK